VLKNIFIDQGMFYGDIFVKLPAVFSNLSLKLDQEWSVQFFFESKKFLLDNKRKKKFERSLNKFDRRIAYIKSSSSGYWESASAITKLWCPSLWTLEATVLTEVMEISDLLVGGMDFFLGIIL
jgi:hypothetical protein